MMPAFRDLEPGDRVHLNCRTEEVLECERILEPNGGNLGGYHDTGYVRLLTQLTPGVTSQITVHGSLLVHSDGCSS